mgnify:CR=1 FL=1
MAYNILKGIVEGSVDQYGDQEIDGIKIFKNTISASVFYDTDAQSPCATMKDVAITSVTGGEKHSVLSFLEDGAVRANYNFTFDGQKLRTPSVHATDFHGSGKNLTDLPANQFTDLIAADAVALGSGLHSVRGDLQVRAREGILVDEEGVSVNIGNTGGLSIKNSKLVLDPSKTDSIRHGGQNLSDGDLLVVSDTSHQNVTHTTLDNFYEGYLKNKIHQSAGAIGDVQIKDRNGFNASSKLSYDVTSHTLQVEGKINTATLKINNSLHCEGAIFNNIKTIGSRIYETQRDDYTLLCDTADCPVTVMLPPACNNMGRVINIKKTNSNKYKINSYPVVLKVAEGNIDLTDEVIIKTNYSSRTVQSDGSAWWIIGSKGT